MATTLSAGVPPPASATADTANSEEEEDDVSVPLLRQGNDADSELVARLRDERAFLESELCRLERELRLEREERRRSQAEMQVDHERDTEDAERRWMEQLRCLREERDQLKAAVVHLEEQLEGAVVDVNRAIAHRMEVDEHRERLQSQLESLMRDYDETMQERSSVLEENARLSEERDRLRVSVRQLSSALHAAQQQQQQQQPGGGGQRGDGDDEQHTTLQVQMLAAKLENTRRMLYMNMHEKEVAAADSGDALEALRMALERVLEERDTALDELRRVAVASPAAANAELASAAIVDHWSTHTFDIGLPFSKGVVGQLGVVLRGGRAEDVASSGRCTPIYVQDIAPGSPFEHCLRRLDHIVLVNDIDVSEMDARSVMDILRNSHHLKVLVRRRASLHRVVELPAPAKGADLGVELCNGVFVNGVERGGAAEKAGMRLGTRIIYVNGTPVYDAKHAEELLKNGSSGHLSLAFLCASHGTTRGGGEAAAPSEMGGTKQKTIFSKMHDKLFRRGGGASSPSSSEKAARSVVARANIDEPLGANHGMPRGSATPSSGTTPGGDGSDYFYRHGSLRLPSSHSVQQHQQQQLIRTASLRAPHGSIDHKRIMEQLDRFCRNNVPRPVITSPPPADAAAGSTWPKADHDEGALVMATRSPPPIGHHLQQPPRQHQQAPLGTPAPVVRRCHAGHHHRPSVIPVFAPTPELAALPDHRRCSCTTCGALSPTHRRSRISTPSMDAPRHLCPPSPVPTGHHRVSTYSPALPQPPPYPGPRGVDDSLSSILSSTNSMPHPSTSSTNNYHTDNSPSETLFSDCDGGHQSAASPRESRGGGERAASSNNNGLMTREASGNALDTAMASARWITAPRREVRIVGGNALGIYSDATVGELTTGDRILQVDGVDVRDATHEGALNALNATRTEFVRLFVSSGGDGHDRMRAGADGDGFYVRINAEHAAETPDELDLKQGEIVYVDNTAFMGQRGRWRAWRVDREGRQRQCGIIPSATVVEAAELLTASRKHAKTTRPSSAAAGACRPVYERVERISSAHRRPVLLFGALIAPFTQALLDDPANNYAQCVPECKALQTADVERLLATGQVIDARRRDKLYDVTSTAAVQAIVNAGLHCILDVPPAAIPRLHALRIYPIVIHIKFKSAKQIKELREEMGEKTPSRLAKELMEKALLTESQLSLSDCVLVTVPVGANTPVKALVRHICQQVKAHVEHEQKKSVWVPAQ